MYIYIYINICKKNCIYLYIYMYIYIAVNQVGGISKLQRQGSVLKRVVWSPWGGNGHQEPPEAKLFEPRQRRPEPLATRSWGRPQGLACSQVDTRWEPLEKKRPYTYIIHMHIYIHTYIHIMYSSRYIYACTPGAGESPS